MQLSSQMGEVSIYRGLVVLAGAFGRNSILLTLRLSFEKYQIGQKGDSLRVSNSLCLPAEKELLTGVLNVAFCNTSTQKHKYTNTNTQTQIHKYKYTNTNTQTQIHGDQPALSSHQVGFVTIYSTQHWHSAAILTIQTNTQNIYI